MKKVFLSSIILFVFACFSLTLNAAPKEHGAKSQKEISIKKALEKYRGKRKGAARELGISERTLYRKINEYGIQ